MLCVLSMSSRCYLEFNAAALVKCLYGVALFASVWIWIYGLGMKNSVDGKNIA